MRWLDGITDSEQILGDSEGQGSLVCCSPWDNKELDKPEQQIFLPVKSCDSRHYGKFQVGEGSRLSGTENMMISYGDISWTHLKTIVTNKINVAKLEL